MTDRTEEGGWGEEEEWVMGRRRVEKEKGGRSVGEAVKGESILRQLQGTKKQI